MAGIRLVGCLDDYSHVAGGDISRERVAETLF